jgi:hypothetical protein
LIDCDIGTPIPEVPEAVFGDFDWFLPMVRLSRLTSRAYEALFSISATLIPKDFSRATIAAIQDELERWKISIPKAFRPGEPFQPTQFSADSSMAATLRMHYYYYSVMIALCRMALHLDTEQFPRRQSKSTTTLMNAARATIELTRHIDVEPYTPAW